MICQAPSQRGVRGHTDLSKCEQSPQGSEREAGETRRDGLRLSTHPVSQFLWLGVACDSSNVKWVGDDSFIFIHTRHVCKYMRTRLHMR